MSRQIVSIGAFSTFAERRSISVQSSEDGGARLRRPTVRVELRGSSFSPSACERSSVNADECVMGFLVIVGLGSCERWRRS
jgi:hypothetical protein